MPSPSRPSPATPRERCFRRLLAVFWLVLGPATAGAEPFFYWLPGTVPADALDQGRTTLYYEGDAGRLVSAEAEAAEALSALGGTRVDVRESHDLYVYVLEDGARAEFELPARVLFRAEAYGVLHDITTHVPLGDVCGDIT
jgi:hypothetical protein